MEIFLLGSLLFAMRTQTIGKSAVLLDLVQSSYWLNNRLLFFPSWRIVVRGPWMEYSRGTGVWKQTLITLRCPFCSEGHNFRPMIELSGRPDGMFFCSSCHHMAHPAQSAFRCECTNCKDLNRGSGRSDRTA